MTTLRTAAQQALEALGASLYPQARQMAAIAALKAALAEPVQEPVWVCPDSAEHRYGKPGHCEDCGKTLVQVAEPVQEPVALNDGRLWQYPDGSIGIGSAPPQRKPLTEEEIDSIWDSEKAFADIYAIARAIERAHGIKEL